jgi:hypothetical protein
MDIATILTRCYADAEWILNGDDYSGLTWLSESTKPTKKALDKLWPEIQAEIAAERKARIDAKASAIAKLEALGLTINEVEAAFGLNTEA